MALQPLNAPDLVDARLVIQDWLNGFRGLTSDEVRAYFDGRELQARTWEHDGEEHPVLEYECHDYVLAIYFFEDTVINTSFQAMQEI